MNNHVLLPAVAVVALIVVVVYILSRCVRRVKNNQVAIVEKIWSRKGSVTSGFIALNGEAGYQPEIKRGGYHWFMIPFQYRLHFQSLVTIPQGQLGYVFARDGVPLDANQTLASNEKTADFLSVRNFLRDGGQKGPQRAILREGTFAINTAQFVIITSEHVHGLMLESSDNQLFAEMKDLIEERNGFDAVVLMASADEIGIVTVHDGLALDADHIIAPIVGCDQSDVTTFHNSFQDPEKFIRAGGRRGRQHQVLVEGSYYINRLFATVEKVAKTIIEVGHVGVVISYTGAEGVDTSGPAYRHGQLVDRKSRGVWAEPLRPGKYAWNTYAGKIVIVPTTNFILKWDQDTTGQHKFDENLSEVSLITKDAFEPTLPLSVVVHIDTEKAPLVIQRFGDIKKLVEQTLDPMVASYFKNVGQTKTLIELLQSRNEVQTQAAEEMRTKFSAYDLELQEVLIGTPRAAEGNDQIEKVLSQLRERQVAEERVATYAKQQLAADAEKSLREAQARAERQTSITESELSITIQQNEGKAAAARATQEADRTRTNAVAEADRIRIVGEGEAAKIVALAGADAERIMKTGLALAETIEKQSVASGGARNQLTRQIVERISEALEKSGVAIVPRVQINGAGGEGGTNGSIMGMLAMALSDKADGLLGEPGRDESGNADETPPAKQAKRARGSRASSIAAE